MRWKNQEEAPEYEEGKTDYSKWELGAMADVFLRDDSRRELCRECEEYGEETGEVEQRPLMHKDGESVIDDDGKQVFGDFPKYECPNQHTWHLGEGKARGIDGKDPILFEEHLQNRRKREIYTQGGTPDPSIESGMYNRTHPQGRKVNSAEQRRKHGASFFR